MNEPTQLPRENLVRALAPGFELREAKAPDGMPTIEGYLVRFDEWTEINSMSEGHFMERFMPGSMDDTVAHDREAFQILFQHGRDPQIGDKVLAPTDELRTDGHGVYYSGQMLDTAYNRELIPGLQRGVYGASFRFSISSDEMVTNPERSDYNPNGLPERSITSAQLYEGGPVTFPQYAGSTAGLRSMTDEYRFGRLTSDPRHLAEVIDYNRASHVATAENISTTDSANVSTSPTQVSGSGVAVVTRSTERPTPKEDPMAVPDIDRFASTADLAAREAEIKDEMAKMDREAGVKQLADAERDAWNDLKAELVMIQAAYQEKIEREKFLADQLERGHDVAPPAPTRQLDGGRGGPRVPDNAYDLSAYRTNTHDEESERALLAQGALKVLERAVFPNEDVNREDAQTAVEKLIKRDVTGETAKRVLATGSDAYARAFAKACRGQMVFSAAEQAALERAAFTLGTTGMPVVWTLDPTVLRTSNYVINPIRAISRVETITGTNEWRGVTSGAVVATYEAEATEAADQTPTLTQPNFKVQRAQTFVPFSREVDQDWAAVQAEMAGLFSEAKDILEATQFLTGAGTTVFPQGVLTGLSTSQRIQHGTTGVFAVADLYNLQGALPPRARNGGATFLSSLTQQNRIRALDTGGGGSLWVQLRDGNPPQLIGMPSYEMSTMTTTLTGAGNKTMLVGDFSKGFIIVDRIGMEVELIPHLFGATNRYPTGQRGLWAMWRNSSLVLDANRFRYLETV